MVLNLYVHLVSLFLNLCSDFTCYKLAQRLRQLVTELYERLDALRIKHGGQRCIKDLVEVPQECPKSPIFSLLSQYPRSLAQYCQECGFVVRAVVPPTVPVGTQRIRVCVHSGNTTEEIVRLVESIEMWILAKVKEGTVQELSIEKPHL